LGHVNHQSEEKGNFNDYVRSAPMEKIKKGEQRKKTEPKHGDAKRGEKGGGGGKKRREVTGSGSLKSGKDTAGGRFRRV